MILDMGLSFAECGNRFKNRRENACVLQKLRKNSTTSHEFRTQRFRSAMSPRIAFVNLVPQCLFTFDQGGM